MNRREWMEAEEHLPRFMRDFHDQKDLFKTVETFFSEPQKEHYFIPWVKAQVYVIDRFLWFMAIHGYTLQKARKKVDTVDIRQTLENASAERQGRSAKVLKGFLAGDK